MQNRQSTSPRRAVSFVIPALNEEDHIGRTIDSVRETSGALIYEIIVVDNGSEDRTVAIAEQKGALVFSRPGLNIGALRNFGVLRASHDIIVFLDADVYLRESWGRAVGAVLQNLSRDGKVITGSICGLRDNASWVEKCWWGSRLSKRSVPYINSGHMIVTRSLFEALGGFDEALRSGEDPELCLRAKRAGARIVNNPALEVVHVGYPANLKQFYRRERWHGRGVFRCLRDVAGSKVTVLALLQGLFLAFCLLLSPVLLTPWPMAVYLLGLGCLCALAAWRRHPAWDACLPRNIILAGAYFFARAHAALDVLGRRLAGR